MSENTISLGKYVTSTYQDLKSKVMEQGDAVEQDQGTRYYSNDRISLGEDSYINYGAAVDNSPKTKDQIVKTSFYTPENSNSTRPNEKIETFSEYMKKGRLIVSYHYLEYMSFEGFNGKAEFTVNFDAKTGEQLPEEKK